MTSVFWISASVIVRQSCCGFSSFYHGLYHTSFVRNFGQKINKCKCNWKYCHIMVTQPSFQDESKFLQGRILGLRPTQYPY